MTHTQEIVLKAVNAVVLRRNDAHRVPECALKSEIIKEIDSLAFKMPACFVSRIQNELDNSLQWLVNHGYLKATHAVNEMTYYVNPQ